MPVMRLLGTATEQVIVDSSAWAPVIEIMQKQVSVSTVVGVVGVVVAAGIGGVFMWWGLRKGAKGLQSAIFRGRLKF